jgi:hypothetical protein
VSAPLHAARSWRSRSTLDPSQCLHLRARRRTIPLPHGPVFLEIIQRLDLLLNKFRAFYAFSYSVLIFQVRLRLERVVKSWSEVGIAEGIVAAEIKLVFLCVSWVVVKKRKRGRTRSL